MLAAVTPADDPEAAEAGEVWLTFPVQTGVGEGTGAMWWSPAAGLATIPLGARSGELELQLSVGGELSAGAVSDAAVAAVAEERAAWDAGAFVLKDGDGLEVGAVQLQGADHPAEVGVWDALWLTDGMVAAQRGDDGGDLLLVFAAEPNVQGEDALLRVNVVTRRVVVPSGPHPMPEDRWLTAEPGSVASEAVDRGVAAAIEAADAQELKWLGEVAARLSADAFSGGACVDPVTVQPAWELLLTGYEVATAAVDGGCAVRLESRPRQHRRRFSGWVGATGVLDRADWPVE